MRLRMEFLQIVGSLVCSDECKNIQLPGFHEGTYGFTAPTIYDINYPGREAIAKCFQQRAYEEDTILSRFEYHGVTHDESRDECREGLVERVVVRSHTERDA